LIHELDKQHQYLMSQSIKSRKIKTFEAFKTKFSVFIYCKL
jgi:hypothetical protein